MNPTDILKYGHHTMLGALDGVAFDRWDVGGVCGRWSLKDIVAHLTSYENMLIEVLSGFTDAVDTPLLEEMGSLGGDAFNDAQVGQRENLTPQQVMAEFNAAHARVMTQAELIPAEVWAEIGTLPWYGPEYALDDFIVYTFYGHKREHAAQVEVFRDSLRKR